MEACPAALGSHQTRRLPQADPRADDRGGAVRVVFLHLHKIDLREPSLRPCGSSRA